MLRGFLPPLLRVESRRPGRGGRAPGDCSGAPDYPGGPVFSTIAGVEYQALYRKHRPQRFDEVVGQRHVTETLAREVIEAKVAHAYLFAGPRGTGKTTTARILAKSLNCPDRAADGEPCGTCDSCVGIADGTSLDVIELDAASHNKVEDIREIRVNVGTVASVGGAYRVYILDEAHMLSRAAGNALLKTLEEPPDHVVFVLATTEPYKLLDTIRSRSQRFDFHPVPSETQIEYAGRIAAREGFTADPDALGAIAQHAAGSVRDALSLLEQVAALGEGTVTAAAVRRALGVADPEAFARLAKAVADGDAPTALSLVATLAAAGADLRRFVADAVAFFRGVFLAHYAPNLEEVVDESTDTIAEWRRQAKVVSAPDVLRAVDQLADALVQLREGREERLVVELALLRLTHPETALDAASLAARLDRLEERARRAGSAAPLPPAVAAEPAASPPPPAPSPPASAAAPTAADEPAVEAAPTAPFESPAAEPEEPAAVEEAPAPPPLAPVAGLDLGGVEAVWPALVARVRDDVGPRRFALFREAEPAAVDGATIVLEVPARLPFHLAQLQEDRDLAKSVEAAAAELLGGRVEVAYRAAAAEEEAVAEAPSRAPAEHELFEAGAGGIDPAELVKDLLDGEVVE